LDVAQPSLGEQVGQAIWQGKPAGEEAVAVGARLRIKSGSGVPEKPLINEAATKIPNCRGDDAAGAGEAPRLGERKIRIAHEIEHQLCRSSGEDAVAERKRASIRDLESGYSGGAPGAGKLDIGRRRIDADDPASGEASCERDGQTPGSAA